LRQLGVWLLSLTAAQDYCQNVTATDWTIGFDYGHGKETSRHWQGSQVHYSKESTVPLKPYVSPLHKMSTCVPATNGAGTHNEEGLSLDREVYTRVQPHLLNSPMG
jgi:hypothetical protein